MKKMKKFIAMMLAAGIIASTATNVYAWQYTNNNGTVYNDSKKTLNTTYSSTGVVKNGLKSTVHQARIKAYDTYNSSNAKSYSGHMKVYGQKSTAKTGNVNYMRRVKYLDFNLT